MRSNLLTICLALTLFTACKPKVKSDADGAILAEQDALAALSDTSQWCAQDLDNDGSYNVESFNVGGSGQFSVYNVRTQTYTSSDPMKWSLSSDRLTRILPASFHPNILTGHVRFGNNDKGGFVKIIGDDGAAEILSTCATK